MYLRGLRGMGDAGDGSDMVNVDVPPPPETDIGANLNDVSSGDFWEMLQPDTTALNPNSSTAAGSMVPFYADPSNSAAVDQLNASAQSHVLPNGQFPPVNTGSAANPISSLFSAIGNVLTGKSAAQIAASNAQRANPLLYTAGSSPFPAVATGLPTLSTPVILGLAAVALIIVMKD